MLLQPLHGIRASCPNFTAHSFDVIHRRLHQFAGDALRGRPALVVSATLSTCPMMVYAGQELGEPALDAEGFSGHDGRTTIFDYWSIPTLRQWLMRERLNGRHPLRDYYKRVLTLCNSERAIASGGMYDLMYVNPHLHRQYAFMRHHEGEVLLIVANFDDEARQVTVDIPQEAFHHIGITPGQRPAEELLHKRQATFNLQPGEPLTIALDGQDAVIWKFDEG